LEFIHLFNTLNTTIAGNNISLSEETTERDADIYNADDFFGLGFFSLEKAS
jgi:hypothetical protein